MSALPPGWSRVPLSEISTVPQQRVPADSERFRYIDIASIERERKVIGQTEELTGKSAPSRARKVVRTGDVLVSMTRPNLNAVALVPPELDGQIASTGFDVLRPNGVDPRWLYYLVRSQQFVDEMSGLVQGALYPAVRSKDVRAFMAPVAPLAEQKRIADKLDRLLAAVDTCKARLDAIPAILKRFRQSVLAAATSGGISAEQLGLKGAVNWRQTTVQDVASVVRGASPRPAGDPRYFGGDTPWITVGELTKDSSKYLESVSSFVTADGRERSRYVEPGTLLLTNSGATLGVPKISKIGGCINDGSVALLDIEEPLKSYLYYVLWGMTEKLRNINRGAAQPNLNTSIVKAIEFSLPNSDAAQSAVVRYLEALLVCANDFEAKIASSRARVAGITQAALEKAFNGGLRPDLVAPLLVDASFHDTPEMVSRAAKAAG